MIRTVAIAVMLAGLAGCAPVASPAGLSRVTGIVSSSVSETPRTRRSIEQLENKRKSGQYRRLYRAPDNRTATGRRQAAPLKKRVLIDEEAPAGTVDLRLR